MAGVLLMVLRRHAMFPRGCFAQQPGERQNGVIKPGVGGSVLVGICGTA